MFKNFLNSPRAPFWLFYIMLFYIVASYIWWMVLLYSKNHEISQNQEDLLKYKWEITHNGSSLGYHSSTSYATIIKHERVQNYMVAGEAFVFLTLVGIGIWQVHKAFSKEIQLNKQQKNFLLSVTHELKSPLASTKINLQTLAKHRNLNEAQFNKFILNSLSDQERLQTLVENLLLAARIESSNFSIVRHNFNLTELLNGISEKYLSTFGHIYAFDSKIENDLTLKADKSAISSIVHNLVDNAIKYAPHGAAIDIQARKIENNVHIRISDSGPGIPETEKEFIFKKFYRVGNEDTRETKGTGLGLYLVRKMLDAHEGFISVTDNIPHGTIFDIILPVNL